MILKRQDLRIQGGAADAYQRAFGTRPQGHEHFSRLQTEEVARGTTGEMDTGVLFVPKYPSEDLAVSVPAEPISVHTSEDLVPSPEDNNLFQSRPDEEVRDPEEKYARLAAPHVARPQNEEMVGPGTPVDLQEFSETATRVLSPESAGAAEGMRAQDTAVEGPAQPRNRSHCRWRCTLPPSR